MGKVGRIAFLFTFTFLATHEMDAIFHAEWRVLPFLNGLDDTSGRVAFTLLHVPIFAGLVYLFWEAPLQLRHVSRVLFSGFCLIHIALHWLSADHPAYRFDSWDANLLILGAGLCGLIHLVTSGAGRMKTASDRA